MRRMKLLAGVMTVVMFGVACSSGGDASQDSTTDADGTDTSDASTDGSDGDGASGEVPDNPDEGVTADTIKIGWMGDATGPTAAAQGFNLRGIQAAVAYHNEQGGVLGRELELLDRDDQFQAEVAATNYTSLVEDENVLALVGLGGAHISTALMPDVEQDQLPVIGPPQSIDVQLENPYVFNNIAHYGDEADVAVEYAADLVGGTENANVAVLQLELPSGDEWDLYIRTELEEGSGTYTDRITMNPGSADFPGTVTRLSQLVDSQGVNLLAFHGAPEHGLGIVTEMENQGVDIPVVGIHGIAGSTIYGEGPEEFAAELVHGVHSFLPGTSDCEACTTIQEFTAGTEWEDAIGEINFGHGWLNVSILVQAIERAGETGELSRASLHEALQGEFETGGLSCPIDWSSTNHSPCAAPFEWLPEEDRIDAIDGIDAWADVLDGEYGLFEG